MKSKKGQNRRKTLVFLLVMLLIMSMLMAISCRPPDDEDDDTEEEATVSTEYKINNGTFYSAKNSGSANAYLKDTVSGWTKTNAATYYSSAKMGVIDMTEDKFTNNIHDALEIDKDERDIPYPKGGIDDGGIAPTTHYTDEGELEDTNALIVGLPKEKGSVYYRNSASVSMEQNKYYRLTIDVYTQLFDKDSELEGAYIVINGGLYVEFLAIDASAGWQTYEVYIESNNFENRTFYVELWMGHGSRYIGDQKPENLNPRLTNGFILFDNVILTDLTEELGEDEAKDLYKDKFDAAGEGTFQNAKYAVASLLFPDKGFTYETKYSFISPGSSTSKTYYTTRSGSANNYALYVGTEAGSTKSEFPSYESSTATTGIFDMSKLYDSAKAEDAVVYDFEDAYRKISTNFRAPDYKDFYNVNTGAFQMSGNRSSETMRETEALLIFHPEYILGGVGYKSNQQFLIERDKYYEISVWAYVWVPKYEVEKPKAPVAPTEARMAEPDSADFPEGEDDVDYKEAYDRYEANKALWNKYDEDEKAYQDSLNEWQRNYDNYNAAAAKASADFKITGTSIDKESGTLTASTLPYGDAGFMNEEDGEPTGSGQWQLLTINVKGNELSDRKVNFEFWYGNGEWGASTGLYPGGAIFDNIAIKVTDEPEAGVTYETLSPIDDLLIEEFGLMNGVTDDFTEITKDEGNWNFEFTDKQPDKDNAMAGIIKGSVAKDDDAWAALPFVGTGDDALPAPGTLEITYNSVLTPFDVLMLYNKDYAATKLTYWANYDGTDGEHEDGDRKYIPILHNKFYRISIWVKTYGLEAGQGLTVALYDDADTQQSSLTNINTDGEWQELVFYVRGSTIKNNDYYFAFQMGSGDIYNPQNQSFVKGVAYMTGIIVKDDITYSEFNSAGTGTYTAKKTISDTPSTTETVSNGYFADLSTSNFDSTKKVFGDDGTLIDVAVPNSWTITSAVNALSAPTGLKIDETGATPKLTWNKVERATHYYIYMDGLEWPDPDDAAKEPKIRDNVLIAIVAAPNLEYEIEIFGKGLFKVRAISIPDPGIEDQIALGYSTYSSTFSNSKTTGTDSQSVVELKDSDINTEFGVIDYKNYKDAEKLGLQNGDDRKDFYNTLTTDKTESQYISQKSDYLLMLSSNYYTRGGYTSSSASLSANSYYMLSVWVKTLDGAKAGVTINNTSKVFAKTEYPDEVDRVGVDGDYIGYVNVDTEGDWIQYRFYIQTSVASSSVQLELFLGNKYAVSESIYYTDGESGYDPNNPQKVKQTVTQGLSKGTVFFDDIIFKTLTKEEYYKLAFGGDPEEIDDAEKLKENNKDVNGMPVDKIKDVEGAFSFVNNYIFKLLDFTTDSFDLYTEQTSTSSPQGGTPKDYTHYTAPGAIDYDSSDEEPSMIYGVYDKRKIKDGEIAHTIASSTKFNEGNWYGDSVPEAEIVDFLTNDVGTGNNYLLMANLADNGQYYLSGTTISLATESYYKVTFTAKALLPEGAYAEFRFEPGNDTAKATTIRITSDGKGSGMNEYSFYVYNGSTNSVSGNAISFHLGSNAATAADPSNFVRGIVIIDNVSFVKLTDGADYDAQAAIYDALTDDEKSVQSFATYKFVDNDEGEEEPGPDDKTPWEPTPAFWLMISSIVVGAILIVAVAIILIKKLQKRVKHAPAKYISNVPVNMTTADDKRSGKTETANKKEIRDDEFND